MRPVLIAQQAWKTIERESLRIDGETGGILVGLQRGEFTLVCAAGTEGPDDRGSHTSFQFSDHSGHHREYLHRVQAGEPSAHLLGIWHKHPSDFRVPSAQDLKNAIEQLEHYDPPRGLLMPISYVEEGVVRLLTYWLPTSTKEWILLPHEVVDLEADLDWTRTAHGMGWVRSLFRELRDAGFETREIPVGASGGMMVEATHLSEPLCVLIAAREDPERHPPEIAELEAPQYVPGEFLLDREDARTRPPGRRDLVRLRAILEAARGRPSRRGRIENRRRVGSLEGET